MVASNGTNGLASQAVRWQRVVPFLALTFGVTYAYNLFMALTVGYAAPALGLMLQGQMLIPACAALVLQVFVWEDHPLYYRRPFSWVRVFAFFYLAYGTGFLVLAVIAGLGVDQTSLAVMSGTTQLVTLGGFVFVILLQFLAPKEERKALGLALGAFKWYVLFAVLLVVLYGVMTAFNYAFSLGEAVNAKELVRQLAAQAGQTAGDLEQLPDFLFVLVLGFQSVFFASLFALLIVFGEEYGWRGFLQGELARLGKVKGIALLGVIWGVWHAPVIVMGHNYPGYPLLGVFLMILYCVCLGFILGYAMLKSGSVWVVAYLHAVNNQVLSFLSMMVYKPDNPVLSFGAGIYGIVLMALVVGLLLLDRRTWKTT